MADNNHSIVSFKSERLPLAIYTIINLSIYNTIINLSIYMSMVKFYY